MNLIKGIKRWPQKCATRKLKEPAEKRKWKRFRKRRFDKGEKNVLNKKESSEWESENKKTNKGRRKKMPEILIALTIKKLWLFHVRAREASRNAMEKC